MNRHIRTQNKCVQWDIDKKYVEMTHGSVRIFMARIDLYENFETKTADALAATAEKLNARMVRILYTRADDASKIVDNCLNVRVLCPHKEMGIMIECLRRMNSEWRIGWISDEVRQEIYCGGEIIASIEPVNETRTHATLKWKFDSERIERT